MNTPQQGAQRPSPGGLRQDGNLDVLAILERKLLLGLEDAVLKHRRNDVRPHRGSRSHEDSPFLRGQYGTAFVTVKVEHSASDKGVTVQEAKPVSTV